MYMLLSCSARRGSCRLWSGTCLADRLVRWLTARPLGGASNEFPDSQIPGQLFDNYLITLNSIQVTYFQIDLTMRSAVKYMRSDPLYEDARGL